MFAREASDYLRDGDVQRALDLCLAGTKTFPDYPSGFLVLGKCYEAFGRTVEALVQYSEALKRLPDNPTLQDLVRRLEDQQKEEFRRFVEQQEKRFELEVPSAEVPPVETEQVDARTEETTVEYLSKVLKNVKRIQPADEAGDATHTVHATERNVSFVTPTMADILANQGKIAEAIRAYKEIIQRQPEEKFVKKLAELELLHASQQKGEGSNS